MATIRPMQIAPVNYDSSNRLLQLAQAQIGQGVTGLQDTLTGYRNAVVDRNTANVVNLLSGASDQADFQQRQQAAQSLLQQAGGDIDNNAVNRIATTMPDTLLSRQTNQLKLSDAENQAHDAPLVNAAMNAYAQGDTKAANALIGQIRGDASAAIQFGARRGDEMFNRGVQQQQLSLQRASLAQRQAAASARASQATAGQKTLQNYLKQISGINANAETADTAAATKDRNDQLTQRISENSLNNPKNNPDNTASEITNNAYSAFLPNFVQADRGAKLQDFAKQLDPNNTLTDKQKSNLLNVMNDAFESNNGWFTGDQPDKAALAAGKAALDGLKSDQSTRLQNTSAQIQQKRNVQLARQQLLLQSLLQNGGNPATLLSQLPLDEE